MSRKPARYVSFLAHGNRHRIAIQLNKEDLPESVHTAKVLNVCGNWDNSRITLTLSTDPDTSRGAHFRLKHNMLFVESLLDDVPSIKRFFNKFFYVTKVEYTHGVHLIHLKYHRDATQVTRVIKQEVSLVQMEPAKFLSHPSVPTEPLPDILQSIRKINDYQRARQTPLELSITEAGLIKVAVEM